MSTTIRAIGSLQKGRARGNSRNVVYFVMGLFSLVLALICRYGESSPNERTITSFFLGTAPVATSLATSTALSVKHPRRGHATMVSMTAGSSRTLIELVKPKNDENSNFPIEVIYIDDDDEDALMVLRRANIETEVDDTKRYASNGKDVFQRAVMMVKNPIVSIVLTGNIASMAGILPAGISGWLPAVSILLISKTKRALPMLQRLGSSCLRGSKIRAPAYKVIFSKMKVKLSKVISFLYENRSKSSPLSDFLSFVDVGDDNRKKHRNIDIDEDVDGSAGPSANPVMA
eukprot:CAMPEP_0197183590 /NCGR_PEP_ID=MMETSP1423-20130617/7899_1 /TAXON_ID=476441 /ORGANISM="Pseudo-nitzschia heimii, Strain UNC1101" /LENGTH=287 /DNA_ID=CAMNT_0042634179 /DNA_START=127 /DNA_END=990 /DNA_ORIENTATION=+